MLLSVAQTVVVTITMLQIFVYSIVIVTNFFFFFLDGSIKIDFFRHNVQFLLYNS